MWKSAEKPVEGRENRAASGGKLNARHVARFMAKEQSPNAD